LPSGSEEGHVADPGIQRLADELDALRLELGTRRGDVVDVERDVWAFFCGANSIPKLAGSQIAKHCSPTQNSAWPCSSGCSPSVST
jgi:hypothetical protein